VPLYALLRYGKHLRSQVESLVYVLAGFGFYAMAGMSSATRNWGAWYAKAGVRIQETFGLRVPDGMTPERYGHWLVDSLLEETLELFGAMFFLAAAIAFYRSVIRTDKAFDHRPGPV
jgi:hypothetical protein